MGHYLFTLILFGLFWHQARALQLESAEIFYTDVRYPKKGFNLTFGVLSDITAGQFMPNSGGILHLLGTVCNTVKYNNKNGLVNVSGTFNIEGVNTESLGRNTYYSGMQLLQTNLASNNTAVQAKIQTPFPQPMGALISGTTFDLFLATAPYFQGFAIPCITYASIAGNADLGSFQSLDLRLESQSSFSLSPSSSPALLKAINSFLTSMNWTLVGVLFEESIFGAIGIGYVEESATNNEINYVCQNVINFGLRNSTVDKSILKQFVTCVRKYNTVQVILLWMSFPNALYLLEIFKELKVDGFTFVAAYKQAATDEMVTFYQEYLAYNFFFTASTQLPSKEEIDNCLVQIYEDNVTVKDEVKIFLSEYFRFSQGCEIYSFEGLDVCTEETIQRGEKCLCAFYDFFSAANDTYKYTFAADAVSLVAEAIYLLENNCTYLNEKYKLLNQVADKDFCTKDFNHGQLSEAISLVNFAGYTGPISFFRASLVRKTAVFNVWQYNASGLPVQVGTSNNPSLELEIDYSAMTFRDGKQPISEIVPQVPDLSDAYAVVFFAIFITQLAIALLLFGWVFWNRKHPILRRKSPLFLSFILLGVVLILIAGILLAIGLKDSTLCILHVFGLVLGLTLIASSLMAKNWRIYRIFNNPNASALYISDRYIIAFPAAMSLVSLALLFTYSFAGGTLFLKQFVAEQNSFYVFELCASPTGWFQAFMVISFYVYFFILLAFTASLALLTRHAHNSFRESKTIALIIYMYFCMGIIFIPLYYVQGKSTDSQTTRFVIQAINICILMVATKAFIFIPELVTVKRWNARRKKERKQRN